MQPLNNKRKNKGLNKLKVNILCMMIKVIRNIFKEKKNKNKWLEEPQKHSSPKKILNNKSLWKISYPKLY